MTIWRATSVLCSASLALVVLAGGVQAQTATPTPEATAMTPSATDAAATATGPREGWMLLTGDAPAFSIQLPPGWSEQEGDVAELAAATSEAGASLALNSTEPSADADFDAYVTRIEKKLEKARKGNVPAVFRSGPGGLIARLEQAPGKRQAASEHSALFLYTTCPDGVRTLSITGEPPAATEDGSPDEWDLIAGAVNPCSSEPVAEPILDPVVSDLAAAYFTLAADANGKIGPIVSQLNKGGAVSRWTKTAGRLGGVYETYGPRFEALAWTPESSPLGDRLVSAYARAADLFGDELARARTVKAVTSRFDDMDAAFLEISTAGRAIRLALGLPTVAR